MPRYNISREVSDLRVEIGRLLEKHNAEQKIDFDTVRRRLHSLEHSRTFVRGVLFVLGALYAVAVAAVLMALSKYLD